MDLDLHKKDMWACYALREKLINSMKNLDN
jgi:hypothetical protein